MNRETRKPGTGSKNPADRGKPNLDSSRSPHLADDEFHEFFSKGDIGDYEGGVARSEPPTKLSESHPDEPSPRHITPEQLARRAFFTRVVGGVVAGCVVLLVVATQFRGGKGAMPPKPAERVMAAQPVSAPKDSVKPAELRAVQSVPSDEAKPAVAPVANVGPSDGASKPATPLEGTPLTAALPSPEAPVPANSPAKTPGPSAEVEKGVSKAAERPVPAVSNKAIKVAVRPAAKGSQAATPELKAPVTAAAPKQSFAAFPVD